MSVGSEAIAASTSSASLGSIQVRLPVTEPEINGGLSALTSLLDRPRPAGAGTGTGTGTGSGSGTSGGGG